MCQNNRYVLGLNTCKYVFFAPDFLGTSPLWGGEPNQEALCEAVRVAKLNPVPS